MPNITIKGDPMMGAVGGGELGMTKENAVKGLRDVADWHYGKYEQTHEEDYLNDGDFLTAVANMLEAQEPVEPTIGGDADGPCRNWWYQCGKCKEAIVYHDKYCRNCGQAAKWDARDSYM